jgi:hypothetical protein
VSTLIPEYLGNYQSALGDDVASRNLLGSSNDPFRQYGERIGEYIMGTINEVPPEWRKIALHSVLEELETGLSAKVTSRANKYKSKHGWSAKKSLQAAITTATSDGLSKEVVKIAKTGKLPPMKSLAGLGTYDGALEDAYAGLAVSLDGYEAMGFCGYSCMKRKAKAAASKVYDAARAPDRAIVKGAKWTGSKIKAGAKATYSWGKKTLKKAWALNCKLLRHKLSELAVNAVGAYYGVPPQASSVAHKAVTEVQCGKQGETVAVTEEEMLQLTQPGGLLAEEGFFDSVPNWAIYGGVGAAGLGLLYFMTRKG